MRQRVDVATIIGFLIGLGAIFFAIWYRGKFGAMTGGGAGTTWYGVFADWNSQWTSVLITLGGTFAAALVNYPAATIGRMFRIAARAFISAEYDPTDVIEQLIMLTRKARREGYLTLEKEEKHIQNRFLKRGIQLIVDGASQDRVRSELLTEINFMRERHRVGQDLFDMLATYAPAFGMLGTIIGLIMLLGQIKNPGQITAGMATALLTTFWGLVFGYLIFMPLSGKLKKRSDEEVFIMQVITEGVLSMLAGENPMVMESKMKAYLAPHLREKLALRKRERARLARVAY